MRIPAAASRVLLTVGMAACLAGVAWWVSRPRVEQLVRLAEQALEAEDVDQAERLIGQALGRDPGSPAALVLQARIRHRRGQFPSALESLAKVPNGAEPWDIEARYLAGELLLQDLKRPSEAEVHFREVLASRPDHLMANDRLAYLLGLSARWWDMIPHQLATLRVGSVRRQRLYLLSLGERITPDLNVLAEWANASPEDPALLAGLARGDTFQGRTKTAIERLRRVVRSHPEWTDAQVLLGRLLFEHQGLDSFRTWLAQLPSAAASHPGVWVLRAMHEERTGSPKTAARCYWEALRRDPNHQQANYQLGLLLKQQAGQLRQAEVFLRRADALERYVQTVNSDGQMDLRDPAAPAAFKRLSALAAELGLVWEAAAWSRLSKGEEGGNRRLEVPVTTPLVRTPPEAAPARRVDLSGWPLPQLPRGASDGPSPGTTADFGPIMFQDVAAELGIDFRYFGDDDRSVPGQRIFETIGGGVAVLDYDRDGRPDLYFTQGCRIPASRGGPPLLDCLYRHQGTAYADATSNARLRETGYGQGVTVGDYDNDGFPDLYVANLGRNRMFHNNGDGTFSDVTGTTGTGSERWSTSCVLADLNGDSFPDLFVVNYLEGPELLQRICRNADGSPRVCPPSTFAAAPDQIYLNLGDGRFDEQSATAGIQAPQGNGLGVVAADFDGRGRLSLFVANDQTPNFLFANETPQQSRKLVFREEGLGRGFALDGNGRAFACMGIAAGDCTGDGLLDLFVTNFIEEPNTLYVQKPGGMFEDETAASGLGPPSLPQLGFGTQFLDADLDGRPDLVVTNGHVDAQSRHGYQMPPQFFRNEGRCRFRELTAKQLGPFFQGRHLGRGLARLDWNGDGREDVVISHLESRAALLSNTTPSHGNWLKIFLCGTESSRDAIGATVTATIDGHQLTSQLTAGDGFQASNERCLVLGLGKSQRIDDLQIRWLSGAVQRFKGLAANQTCFVIEGGTIVPRK